MTHAWKQRAWDEMARILQEAIDDPIVDHWGFVMIDFMEEISQDVGPATHEPPPTSWQYPEQDGWPQAPGIYEIGWHDPDNDCKPLKVRSGWDGVRFFACRKKNVYAWRLADEDPPPLVKGE
ncbi:MAG: hypothetical protein DRP52_02600 [Planctomycetota bacterium]|nr:MAG: hypothetical protein DRP52_02600 [Planctomycetota bacterium]